MMHGGEKGNIIISTTATKVAISKVDTASVIVAA